MLEEWLETNKIRKFEPIEGIDVKFLRNRQKTLLFVLNTHIDNI